MESEIAARLKSKIEDARQGTSDFDPWLQGYLSAMREAIATVKDVADEIRQSTKK